MCGIAGIISQQNDINASTEIIRATLEVIRHRGPDRSAIFSTKESLWNICFGVNRLAIIDITDSGNQPMHFGSLSIAYNGEVYNYLEIRDELIQKGHTFIGNSDTEVILHAFKEWGVDCIHKFIGMFAIVIFDKSILTVFFFRDRVGEKPLYYYCDKNNFIFSSEIKGILIHNFVRKEFDLNCVFNYLAYSSVSAPYTLFRGIRQLSPGELTTLSLNNNIFQINTAKYWQFPDLCCDYSLTERKVLSDLERILFDAVKLRLRSDVPLGILLSGGIDSSLIASIASEACSHVKAFTIGYRDKRHDETRYAQFVADHLKLEHSVIYLKEDEANLNFESLAYISDDLSANISLIPHYNLFMEIKRFVKVALSGAGADEFFCGYTKSYGIIPFLFDYRHLLKFLSWVLGINKAFRVINEVLSDIEGVDTLIAQLQIRSSLKTVKSFFNCNYEKLNIFRRLNLESSFRIKKMKADFLSLNFYDGGANYLTDTVLRLTDIAGMSNSIEVRPVFTDHRIIEYVAKIPKELILKNGIDKFLLRKLLSKYLPEKFVFSRRKKGFSFPLISDYRRSWDYSVNGAVDILRGLKDSFLNIKELEGFLSKKSNRFNIELQSRIVFLLNFLKIWG